MIRELKAKDIKMIKEYLMSWKPKIRLGKEKDLERFLKAVHWICYSGSQLRELPAEYGNGNTVYNRYADWGRLGIWQGLLTYISAQDSDLEYVMVDSTVIRAHACCTTGKKETQTEEGLGRSKGGLTSKIHMISDALGMPLAFSITGGEKADCSEAIGLLEQCKYDYALMDKAYDSHAIIAYIESTGAVAVIPGRSNRKVPRDYDKLY